LLPTERQQHNCYRRWHGLRWSQGVLLQPTSKFAKSWTSFGEEQMDNQQSYCESCATIWQLRVKRNGFEGSSIL